MKSVIIIAATVFLFACNSTSNTSTAQQTASNKVEMKCEVSSMTGSKLKRKRCVDKRQAEYEKKNAKRLAREAMNNASIIENDG